MEPQETTSTQWRLQQLEQTVARVESKIDGHMDKIDARFSRTGEYILEKFEEIQRELAQFNKTLNEGYLTRREYTERHVELQTHLMQLQRDHQEKLYNMQKDQRDESNRVNLALITSGLTIIASAVLHFLPTIGVTH